MEKVQYNPWVLQGDLCEKEPHQGWESLLRDRGTGLGIQKKWALIIVQAMAMEKTGGNYSAPVKSNEPLVAGMTQWCANTPYLHIDIPPLHQQIRRGRRVRPPHLPTQRKPPPSNLKYFQAKAPQKNSVAGASDVIWCARRTLRGVAWRGVVATLAACCILS